ncbi:MAG: NAD+ synthase [Candidatus Nanopelagicaceae bacterium]|nr:NAD+ synthase [Candidatus Nanopelagicaceae bacterium]
MASAQINPIVGDIKGNVAKVLEAVLDAKSEGANLVLFPEMVVTGYPVEDLALRPAFRRASIDATKSLATELLAKGCGEILVCVGFLDDDGRPLNSIALIYGGEIKAKYVKRHLPNYGVFDEFRNFAAGLGTLVVRFRGVDIGVAICEDIWRDEGPMHELASRKPGLVLVPNGSPYERSKDDLRFELVKKRALQIGAPILYTNMFGGQDDLVFDGDSMLVDESGSLVARSPQFQRDLLVVDLPVREGGATPDLVISESGPSISSAIEPRIASSLTDTEEIWSALVLGLRDYIEKNGFKSVVLGLSGGIDSAVVATIAVDALGKDRVFGVSLPSKYSSSHSKSDAAELAKNLGINFRTIEIEPVVEGYLKATTLQGLAEENVQARVRGSLLMGLSNQEGHLVLATGNKSELAVGYSTLYGDAVGGYAPIKDVFKVDVWRLAKWRNLKATTMGEIAPIPESSITKEPSAELRPGQKDSDSIPDYKILDEILELYIDKGGDASAIIDAGHEKSLVERIIQLVDRAEYKRRQYPPGPKVTPIAFGKDRRLPMTSRWREGN